MADGWPDDPQLVKPNEGNEIILYIAILYHGNSRRCSAKCACIPVRDHAGMHVQDGREGLRMRERMLPYAHIHLYLHAQTTSDVRVSCRQHATAAARVLRCRSRLQSTLPRLFFAG